ncbi:MAG: hypothetical protein KAI43_07490 [Candidatus Aureabacteria bacterium]|nr:hypothetical protein [Candidatus Auribacterota bacterium]
MNGFCRKKLFFLLFFFTFSISLYAKEITPDFPVTIYKEKFAVDYIAYFIPTLWVGDHNNISFNSGCTDSPKSGRHCLKFTYDTKKPSLLNWSGICWTHPAQNTGNINAALDLSKAKELSLWARGETGGEELIFKMGGSYGVFSDSGELIFGPVRLTKEWKKYTFFLKGEDLSHISLGFGWIAEKYKNTSSPMIFYLDNVIIK